MRPSERGNAVVFILLGIALFAGLAYTFTRGAKTGQGNLTAEQTRMLAQKIINNTTQIKRTTGKLLGRGCSENELDFYTDSGPFTDNPVAPADGRCDLFSQGAKFEPFTGHITSITASGAVHVDGTKTDAGDLTYAFSTSNDALCREINRQLGIKDAGEIPEDSSVLTEPSFIGGFTDSGSAEGPVHDEDPRLKNKQDACVNYTASGGNKIIITLIDR